MRKFFYILICFFTFTVALPAVSHKKSSTARKTAKIHAKSKINNSQFAIEDSCYYEEEDMIDKCFFPYPPGSTDTMVVVPDKAPDFPGGKYALIQFLDSHLNYPEEAVEDEIEGEVILRFVVSKRGYVGQIEVLNSIHPILDDEAIRVVKTFPRFTPAMYNGQNVDCYYTLPINFNLNW